MKSDNTREIDDRIQNIGVNGTVATHPEVCEILEALNRRIAMLENRIKELENAPRPSML